MRFEPSGFTKNPQIPFAKSIVDYLFRWLASKFLDEQAKQEVGVVAPLPLPSPGETIVRVTQVLGESGEKKGGFVESSDRMLPHRDEGSTVQQVRSKESSLRQAFINQADAPPCPDCGCIMVRNGACYKCMNCGTTSGCS
jgi:ribonucleoside-diphosphate reductase alpha chain